LQYIVTDLLFFLLNNPISGKI